MSDDSPRSGTAAGVSQSQSSEETRNPSGGSRRKHSVVMTILETLGQEAVIPLVDSAVDVLFSDTVRDRLEQEAAEGLQDLIYSARDALAESSTGVELGQELEKAQGQLQPLLRESIEKLFSGQIRADFQEHIEQAAQVLVEGNTVAAREQAELALQTLLGEILHALQGHWAELLRILLSIASKALEEALASHIKEAFASIAALPEKEIEEKVEPLEEQIAAKAEDLRERLVEARDTMQERLEEARDQLQGRLGEAGSPGMSGGTQGQSRLGQPPSRRPPPGPSPRVPGKPPRGLPPSITP